MNPSYPHPSVPQPGPQGDATGGLIPYKNGPALTSYYLGIFSIIPFLGLLLALVEVPLGIAGIKKYKKQPVVRGVVHAWVGIIAGSLSILGHLAVLILIVMAASHSRR